MKFHENTAVFTIINIYYLICNQGHHQQVRETFPFDHLNDPDLVHHNHVEAKVLVMTCYSIYARLHLVNIV